MSATRLVWLLCLFITVASGELCGAERALIPGKWHSQGQDFSPNVPPCCSWDGQPASYDITLPNGTYAKCRNFRKGSVWKGVAPGPQSNILQASGGHGCSLDCSQRLEMLNKQQWRPDNCQLDPWNATRFCELLGNRSVLMIGDSTMEQTSAVLHNMINWGNGTCAPALQMALSDTLVGLSGRVDRGSTWNEYVSRLDPRIIVISAGPHIHKKNSHKLVWSTVRDQFLSHFSGKLQLIWRTSTGAGCSDEPLTSMPADTPGYWAKHNAYNYKAMEEADSAAFRFWSSVPNVTVMDLRPLWMRPDAAVGKGNCVHMCSPGVLQLFSIAFLNILERWALED